MSSLDELRHRCDRPLPHPDWNALRDFGAQIVQWVIHHHTTLNDQSIGRTASRAELEGLLCEPLSEEGQGFERVFTEFQEKVAPYAFRVNHPRFAAFIPGAPNFFSILGDWLCAGTNFFDGVWLEACGPTQVELVVLDWFKDWLGYPAAATGILTGGGSEATLTALVVAREHLSFADRQRAVLYQSEHRHWSVDRAVKIIGMRPEQVRLLPADSRFRLRAATLAEAVTQDRRAGKLPWAVVASAGTTNTGAVDPMAELADVARREQLWLHVDAAYGWPAVLTKEGRDVLRGIEQADSITLDPHKWLAQTFEAGCVLVRDGRRLTDAFMLRPEYMQDVEPGGETVNFADRGIALTRRFRALKIWLSLKVLGLGWFRQLIEHCCRLADFAQELLSASGRFEILSPRSLSIVGFRFVPAPLKGNEAALNQLNQGVFHSMQASGRAFLSTTRIGDKIALRLCFVNWRTTAADVEEIVKLLEKFGQQAELRNLNR